MAVDRVAHGLHWAGDHHELGALVDEDSKQAIFVLYNLVSQILTKLQLLLWLDLYCATAANVRSPP